MTPKDTAAKLKADFASLTENYRKVIGALLQGLDPKTTQKERNELRKVFAPLAENRRDTAPAGAQKPDVPAGDTPLG